MQSQDNTRPHSGQHWTTQARPASKIDPLEGLEATQRASTTFHLPDFVKPCLASVLDLGVEHRRNNYCYALACELRRVGYDDRKAQGILLEWNEKLSEPLSTNEVQGCLKSAYKDSRKNYGCNSELLLAYCVGKDICPFHKQLKTTTKEGSSFDYVSRRWLPVLTASEGMMVALIMPMIESRRHVARGAWLTVSYREIRRYTGYCLGTIHNALHGLHEKGLIELMPGDQMKGKKASQIRRILPIPKPQRDQKWEL